MVPGGIPGVCAENRTDYGEIESRAYRRFRRKTEARKPQEQKTVRKRP